LVHCFESARFTGADILRLGEGAFRIVKPHSRFVRARGGERFDATSLRIAFKAAADLASKVVTFLVMVAAARALSTEAFGVLAVATTTGWLLGVATDAGWSMHLAREVARRRSAWRATFTQIVTIRAGLAGAAIAASALVANRLVPGEYFAPFVMLVAAHLANAVLETVGHLFRGLERSEIEAAVQVSQRLLAGALAGFVLWSAPNLEAVGWALAAPPLAALAACAVIVASIDGGARDPSRALTWTRVQRDVLPLGAAALLSALYFRCDIYLVERWHGLEAAGAYNAVFRLVEATRLLPAAVMAVTFPRLCRARDLATVTQLGGQLTLAGSVIGAITATAAPWIVVWAYGEPYRASAGTLSILAFAIPLFFLNYALTHQVIGWDGQRAYLAIAALALVLNVLANVSLVPRFGAGGAAAATVITEVLVTVGCVFALWSRVPGHAPAAAEGGG
jgi:O-antigen/teichoic acid export membrane protein